MQLSYLLISLFFFLIYPAIIANVVLYLYPAFFGCRFPAPEQPAAAKECMFDKKDPSKPVQNATKAAEVAPFRLLVFGDPQLEGDTSLPDPNDPVFPSVQKLFGNSLSWDIATNVDKLKATGYELFQEDIPSLLYSYRKRIDLVGNDFYLAHIYRTLHWWTQPTHTAVLGDLIGSQWVSDEEFERRGKRFWKRVFRRGQKVEDNVASRKAPELLGQDPKWSRRVINIAGNHDIGYAGDLDRARIERFEKTFGRVNWDARFQLPQKEDETGLGVLDIREPLEIRIVVLNSMNLDSPTMDPDLQRETYDFINSEIIVSQRPVEDRRAATVVLTHIPLHKSQGICKDGPYFKYASSGIQEQNHLSLAGGNAILEGIFGMSLNPNAAANGRGRSGIILTGHDHEGCDVYHHKPEDATSNATEWQATRTEYTAELRQKKLPGVREITVRSMMGDFDGNAGLLSGWYDYTKEEWRFEYTSCQLGVQHIWWAVHGFDLFLVLLFITSVVTVILENRAEARALQKVANKTADGSGKGDLKVTRQRPSPNPGQESRKTITVEKSERKDMIAAAAGS